MEAYRSEQQFIDDDESTLSVSELFRHIRAKWRWYVVSFVGVFVLAALYLLSASYSYTRTVQVLLKSDSSQFMTTDLESLGIRPVNSAIIDEMFILSSPAVMQTVVERLGINNVYTTRKGLRSIDLYRKSPVEVELLDSLVRDTRFALSMKIDIEGDSTFTIGSLRLPKQMGGRISGEFAGTLGDTVTTPAGRIAVYATRNFSPAEWDGRCVAYAYSSVPVCARRYCEDLKADYDEEAGSVITLSISSRSEQKADDVLRGIVEAYNERWIDDRNKIAMSTSQFIEERLGSIENELSAVEGNITDYQSRHAIVDMEEVSSMYLQQSVENRRALEELAQEIAAARYIKRELADNDITKLLPAMTGISGAASLQSMVESYNDMVIDRNLRLQSMDSGSPLLARKTAAITEMRQAIIESLDQTLAILGERLGAMQLIDSGTRHRLSDAPGQSRYLMSEDRKQKVMESLYVYLLQRREENQLSQAFTAYNTRMVTEPYGKPGPTSPNTRNVLLIAFVLALLIPTVIIYVGEVTNTKVRSRDDLDVLSVPYIGEIPHVAVADRKKRDSSHTTAREVMVRPHSGDIVNEAFRMVRTNIEFMERREEGRSSVMMVMSLVPGSGKTFISLNLAATFAIKNKKVCLVDMDLRKGTLSHSVGSPRVGLTDVLVGNARLDDVLVHDVSGISGFDVLPEGTIPPNPTELLFSPRVKDVIDELKRRYDYVLLDCPPVEAVADAKVINEFVDLSVFVVRAGLLDRSNLQVIQGYYDSGRFNNLAVVLNDTQEIHGTYGRYGYGNYISSKRHH